MKIIKTIHEEKVNFSKILAVPSSSFRYNADIEECTKDRTNERKRHQKNEGREMEKVDKFIKNLTIQKIFSAFFTFFLALVGSPFMLSYLPVRQLSRLVSCWLSCLYHCGIGQFIVHFGNNFPKFQQQGRNVFVGSENIIR